MKSLEAKRKPLIEETARARRLRRDGTDAEALLWRRLRNRQLDNVKFRRQEPVLGFTADFVAHDQRLIIEVDGGQHAVQEEKDARRTEMLERAGFRVLRFWNNDVLSNIEGVLETIRLAWMDAEPKQTLSSAGRRGGRPERAGEGIAPTQDGGNESVVGTPSPPPSPRWGEGDEVLR